jgi:APA family basic amino acid/polyamine antiporter
VIVSVTLGSLLFFVLASLPSVVANGLAHFTPFFAPPSAGVSPVRTLFHAVALMFVAYAGYSRIATLGEEARDPQRTIPRAIVATLAASVILYGSISIAAIGAAGADDYAEITRSTFAPLEIIANRFGKPGAGWVLAIGAMMAMLSVLFHLILGLSRAMLAMGRRHDMPVAVARVDKAGKTPEAAVIVAAAIIAALVLVGDIRFTWSFGAFTVLIYYAITNLAALQLPADKRRYPRAIAMGGLLACLFLAFWVEPTIWLTGLALIGIGLIWHWGVRKL